MYETNEYIYIWTPEEADLALKEFFQYSRLGTDIETYCLPELRSVTPLKMQALDPHTGDISVIAIGSENQKPRVLDWLLLKKEKYDWSLLKELFTTRDYIIAQNATFELKWFYHCLGVWFPNFHCTLAAARLHGNATGSKFAKLRKLSLGALCRDFLGIAIKGKGEGSEQVTDWHARPITTPDQKPLNEHDIFLRNEWLNQKVKYSASDVSPLFKLHDILEEVIVNPLPYSPIIYEGTTEGNYGLGMKKTYKQTMEALIGFAMIEYNGLPVSKPLMDEIYENVYDPIDMTGEAIHIAGELCQEFGLETEEDWFTEEIKPSPKSLKSLNSPAQLSKLISRMISLGKLDTVDAQTVQRIIDLLGGIEFYSEDEYQQYQDLKLLEESDRIKCSNILRKLVDYKRLMKLRSIDLRSYINPVTGCIHSSVRQAAAATGRCIAKGSLVTIAHNFQAKEIPIEQVTKGDFVFSCNSEGKLEIREVLNSWNRGISQVVEVKWRSRNLRRSGSIKCTPEHKFKTVRGWVEAKELTPHDSIFCFEVEGGQRTDELRCHEVHSVKPCGQSVVYDLEVNELNNFICEEVCVHNSASSSPNSQNYSGRTPVHIERPLNNIFPQTASH